jgi:hypothetical protein
MGIVLGLRPMKLHVRAFCYPHYAPLVREIFGNAQASELYEVRSKIHAAAKAIQATKDFSNAQTSELYKVRSKIQVESKVIQATNNFRNAHAPEVLNVGSKNTSRIESNTSDK